MSGQSNIVNEIGWDSLHLAESCQGVQNGSPHLLLVGHSDHSRVFDSLRSMSNFQLSLVADYRELWAAQELESLQLAILFDSLHSFELEASCRLIRRRWPKALILIFRHRMDSFDRSLYDARLEHNVTAQNLYLTALKLTGRGFQSKPGLIDKLDWERIRSKLHNEI
jgi:hypothetical protein